MAKNWSVTEADETIGLPSHIAKRYPNLPKALGEIICGLKSCVSPDDKQWLLTSFDYAGKNDSAFKWNEFEIQSLEAAEGDAEWQKDIVAFWDQHLPISLSVRNGYEYAALCTEGDNKGKVVSGSEPEYEEVSIIAKDVLQYTESLG